MSRISTAHNAARLVGSRNFIDAGDNPARLALYATAKTESIEDAPLSDPLVEIELSYPSGIVDETGYTITQADDGLVMLTGVALWARLFTRAGLVAADFDVRLDTDPVEMGEVAMPQTQLYAGGVARIMSIVLT